MMHGKQWHGHYRGAGASVPYRRRMDVRITESGENGGEVKHYFIKDPTSGEVFQVGPEEHLIFGLLDGSRSFEEIQARFQSAFRMQLNRQQFDSLLRDFVEMGLVEPSQGTTGPTADDHGAFGNGASYGNTRQDPPFGSAAKEASYGALGAAPEPAGAPRPTRDHRLPGQIHLFDPTRLLALIGTVLWPMRYLNWALIPGTLVGGLVLMHRFSAMQTDLHLMFVGFSGLVPFLLSLFTVNLISRIVQGVVIQRNGGRVESFGLLLVFGLFPRFYIEQEGVHDLQRRGRLWAYGAPLLTRLAFFCIGIIVWAIYRQSGTMLPQVALLISQLGLWTFVISAIPLLRMEGYLWLSHYLGRPQLREQAYKLLGLRVRGFVPPAMSGKDKWALTLFAIGCLLTTAALGIIVALYVAIILEERFHGTGVAVFLGLFAAASLWLLAMRATVKRLVSQSKPAVSQSRTLVPLEDDQRGVVALSSERHLPVPGQSHAVAFHEPFELSFPSARKKSYRPLIIWSAIAGCLAVVAFLPYDYETGGDFTILPRDRIEIRARVSGEVIDILANEGDWVEQGDIIGRVSDWDEVRNVTVTEAELERAKAHLRSLQNSPIPEEIALAQKQVESAGARVPFAKAQAERASKLVQKGTYSIAKAEALLAEYDQALTDLAVARANLELVKAGPMQNEIDAAAAEVERLTQELRFRKDELERTRIRATADGRIVTANLWLDRGKFLDVGALFAEIEDDSVARAQIEVPESDIGFVTIGSRVRVKAWAFSDTEVPGTVVAIAPTAEAREFGMVVRVLTDIPNGTGMLKPNMTGYAKIEGAEMPVWEAYSRMIMRFFRIEIWSWIP